MTTSMSVHRPALRTVLLFSGGILLAKQLQLDFFAVYFSTVSILALSALVILVFDRKSLVSPLVSLLVISLGASLQSYQMDEFALKQLLPVEENEQVVFSGAIVEGPTMRPNRTQFVLEIQAISRVGIRQDVQRRVVVHGRPDVFVNARDKLEEGVTVVGKGILEDYPRQRNPGEFDYGRYLELNGIHGTIVVKDPEGIQVFPPQTRSWLLFPRQLRASLLHEIDQLHSEQVAGFLRGILLADRSTIPEDVKQSFVDTGTIHVLAVSGLHVGVIAFIFYGVFGLLRFPRKLIVVCTIFGLLFYMILVGAPPSVVRATVMAIVILVGLTIERKVDVYQSLSVAALILLLWDSNNLFNVGFQLSFAAVLSIVYFYPHFDRFLGYLPVLFHRVRPLKWVLQLFAVSLAAQVGTLPFTAYYFGQISIVSLIANVVVVPVVGLNVVLGFTALVLNFFSTWLAQNYAALNDLFVSHLLVAVRYAAHLPYASVHTAHLDAMFPLYYYIGILGIVNVSNRKVVKSAVILGLLLANVAVYYSLFRFESDRLKVTVIDVWQGDAVLLEFPSGKSVLLDAGSRSDTFDSGERTIAPLLRHKGITTLDALIVSHPHSDHIGGVPYLLGQFTVKRLIESSVRGESATYTEVHQIAAEHAIPVERYEAGETIDIDENARLYVLNPYFLQDSTESLNNASLVIKLVYGSSELLLAGDAEARVEGKLLRRYQILMPSFVLKVGHHGSNTSSSPEFIRAVHPNIAIISSGKNNKFGHPSREVLTLFRKQGVELRRTDKEGAVLLESDGESFSVVNWRQEY